MTRSRSGASAERSRARQRGGVLRRPTRTRRAFVGGALGVSFAALAGCAGAPESEAGEPTEEPTTAEETTDGGGGEVEEELPEGVSEEEFVSGPVPEPYQMAVSQAGEQRDPENLQTKENVRFQEAEDAVEEGLVTPGPNCGNCAEYIPDMNGDGFGACAKVEGYIDPEDWCVIWESMEEEQAESS